MSTEGTDARTLGESTSRETAIATLRKRLLRGHNTMKPITAEHPIRPARVTPGGDEPAETQP